ncbi:MAG: peptidylprolyl isomerase [Bacteroidia bacterium]
MVQMYDSLAPITTANFLDYVEQKYYDGVIFHRVIDDFMIQGGDGAGNPDPIQDEFDPALSNIQKTISMANSGPNTGNTQFFINLVDNTYLDYNKTPFTSKHPVFGIVVDSFEVVQRIGKVPTNISNRPFNDVVMDSVRKVEFHADPPFFLPESFRISPSPINHRTQLELPEENASAHGYSNLQIELKCFNQYGEEVFALDQPIKTPLYWIELEELNQLSLSPGTYYMHIIKSPAGFGVVKFIVL